VTAPWKHGACANGGRPFTPAYGNKKGAPPVHSGSGTPRRELYADWGKSQGKYAAYTKNIPASSGTTMMVFRFSKAGFDTINFDTITIFPVYIILAFITTTRLKLIR